jgi:hypothetical protein
MFEVDVLVNRIASPMDWAQEKANRVESKLAKIGPDEVYNRAVSILTRSSATRKSPRRFSWEDYWKNRWQWSAAGSIHSQYDDDSKYCKR